VLVQEAPLLWAVLLRAVLLRAPLLWAVMLRTLMVRALVLGALMLRALVLGLRCSWRLVPVHNWEH